TRHLKGTYLLSLSLFPLGSFIFIFVYFCYNQALEGYLFAFLVFVSFGIVYIYFCYNQALEGYLFAFLVFVSFGIVYIYFCYNRALEEPQCFYLGKLPRFMTVIHWKHWSFLVRAVRGPTIFEYPRIKRR
ncbi:hypothetical protein L211DRAFT_891941, partial [Terfezia boudieri ATCC MYA-4762]